MINIPDDMKSLIDNAVADRLPCVLGTASKDGHPQISMRGSMMVFDRETLAYWERSKRSALENINENPQVVVFYRNPEKRINWRFHGRATVYEQGPIREDVMNRTVKVELDRDPERQGVAVLVRVDRISDLAGNLLQQR